MTDSEKYDTLISLVGIPPDLITGEQTMKTETFELEIASAYGKVLPEVVKGSYDASIYETKEEIPSGKLLNDTEYVAAVNSKTKAAARSKISLELLNAKGKEYAAANPNVVLNPYLKPDPNNKDVQAELLVKQFAKFHGISEDAARQVLQGANAAASAIA